jgi:hypothetical protein
LIDEPNGGADGCTWATTVYCVTIFRRRYIRNNPDAAASIATTTASGSSEEDVESSLAELSFQSAFIVALFDRELTSSKSATGNVGTTAAKVTDAGTLVAGAGLVLVSVVKVPGSCEGRSVYEGQLAFAIPNFAVD